MHDLLFNQFALTRKMFLKTIKGVEEDLLDVQPEELNNTIRWHIGHVLTTTEQFLFGFPGKSKNLPEFYLSYFGNGTSPRDWRDVKPSKEELVVHLQTQIERIQAIPADVFDKNLKQPFMGLQTIGELANMAAFHEAHHLGQITVIKLLVNNHASFQK